MMFKFLIIILLSVALFSCADTTKQKHFYKKHLGIYFDHDGWTGSYYKDKNGNKYLYRSISTIITNDSTIPLKINLNLQNESNCTQELNESKLKIFILPENLNGRKQYSRNVVSEELKKFLDFGINKPSILNKIINPNEEINITIGILQQDGPDQMALATKVFKPHFFSHDSIITESISKLNPLDLLVILDYKKGSSEKPNCQYLIIPCGQISYIR